MGRAIGAPFLGTGASLAERPLYTPTLERRWPTCNQNRTQEDTSQQLDDFG